MSGTVMTYVSDGRLRVPNYVIDRERSVMRHQLSGREIALKDPDDWAELRRAQRKLKGLAR